MNLPFMWYKNLGGTFVRSLVQFVTLHACDEQTDRRTDGQTDGRTDTFAVGKTACILQRGKNCKRTIRQPAILAHNSTYS